MDVGSIMSPLPVTLSPQSSLDEATEMMDAYAIRHLPVVDDGRLVGMVADRDLLAHTGWRAARDGRPPESPSNEHRRTPLSEVMHPPATRLAPEDSLLDAARGIAEQRVGCLAVERDGVLIGIVTELDVLGLLAERESKSGPTCGALMTRAMETIASDATLLEALERCESEGIHHLPVLDGNDLVGMLSDRDLARAIGRGLSDDTPVEQLMSKPAHTIEAEQAATAGAALMSAEKVSALPVIEDGALAGLLSVTDLLELAQEALG